MCNISMICILKYANKLMDVIEFWIVRRRSRGESSQPVGQCVQTARAALLWCHFAGNPTPWSLHLAANFCATPAQQT